MKTKICTTCNIEKSLDCFAKNPQKKDGLNYKCKECQNKYIKEHYKNNKQYYVEKAKENKRKTKSIISNLKSNRKQDGCSICGENHPATLDFHHKNKNDKSFTIGQNKKHYGVETVKKELDKCIVLCSNCHRKLHWQEEQSREIN
jgi:hypothetical protein